METPKRGRLLAKEEEDWDERVTDAGEWKKVEMTSWLWQFPTGTKLYNWLSCVGSQCLPPHTLLQFPPFIKVNQCSHFSFIGTHRVSSTTYAEQILLNFYHFPNFCQFCPLSLFWPLVAKLRFYLQERFALGGTVKDAAETSKVRVGALIERKNSNNDLYCFFIHILTDWWHLIF